MHRINSEFIQHFKTSLSYFLYDLDFMVPIYTIGGKAFFADFVYVKTCYLILNVSKTSKRAYRTRLLSTQLESTTRVSTNVELWFRPSNLMTKVTLSHRIYLSKRKRTKVEGPNPVLQINKLLTQLESSLLTSVHGIRRIRVFAQLHIAVENNFLAAAVDFHHGLCEVTLTEGFYIGHT